jgi:hypothetical protein
MDFNLPPPLTEVKQKSPNCLTQATQGLPLWSVLTPTRDATTVRRGTLPVTSPKVEMMGGRPPQRRTQVAGRGSVFA